MDTECVEIVSNLIKKQSVFLTNDSHTALWTEMFECLMRVFQAAPRLCAEGIFDLCDAGGSLGLQQVPKPTDLIRNFYLVRPTCCSNQAQRMTTISHKLPLYRFNA